MTHVITFRSLAPILAILCVVSLIGAVSAGPTVPLKGRADGQLTNLVPGEPTRMDFIAAGVATHLGRYTEIGGADVYADGTVQDGASTKTAADGSTLSGNYSGTWGFISATEVEFHLTFHFTHGTGRFASATGVVEVFAVMDFVTGQFYYEKAGTLNLR